MIPSRADSNLNLCHVSHDLAFPQVVPIFQNLLSSNLKIDSSVRKPIAGDAESEGLEERLLHQIGKNNFIKRLLPPKQLAPPVADGKCNQISNHQIISNYKYKLQTQIQTYILQKQIFGFLIKFNRPSSLVYPNNIQNIADKNKNTKTSVPEI